jgi:hypothetical protein
MSCRNRRAHPESSRHVCQRGRNEKACVRLMTWPAIQSRGHRSGRADQPSGGCRTGEGHAWRLEPHRSLCFCRTMGRKPSIWRPMGSGSSCVFARKRGACRSCAVTVSFRAFRIGLTNVATLFMRRGSAKHVRFGLLFFGPCRAVEGMLGGLNLTGRYCQPNNR